MTRRWSGCKMMTLASNVVLADRRGIDQKQRQCEMSRGRRIWHDAVRSAIERLCASKESNRFTRRELIAAEMHAIESETGTQGRTPEQTLSRILQDLRREQFIEFLDNRGTYRIIS